MMYIHLRNFIVLFGSDNVPPFKESYHLFSLDDVHQFKESYRLFSVDDYFRLLRKSN